MLLDGGVSAPKLIVSDRAHVLMPYHVLLDTYEEDRLAGKAYGSTKSGIAPFYADKVSKIGIQVNELFDDDAARTPGKSLPAEKKCAVCPSLSQRSSGSSGTV